MVDMAKTLNKTKSQNLRIFLDPEYPYTHKQFKFFLVLIFKVQYFLFLLLLLNETIRLMLVCLIFWSKVISL